MPESSHTPPAVLNPNELLKLTQGLARLAQDLVADREAAGIDESDPDDPLAILVRRARALNERFQQLSAAAAESPVVSLGQGDYRRDLTAEDLTPVDPRCVAELMESEGGGFVSRLGAAYLRADLENRRRIQRTWPEYWRDYEGRVRESDRRIAARKAGA